MVSIMMMGTGCWRLNTQPSIWCRALLRASRKCRLVKDGLGSSKHDIVWSAHEDPSPTSGVCPEVGHPFSFRRHFIYTYFIRDKDVHEAAKYSQTGNIRLVPI